MSLWKRCFLVFLVVLGISPALCSADCISTYGHGYCTDYIAQKTGKSQSGDAKNWCGNISSSDVAAGDVAIFDFGKWGHVAYIEGVNQGSDGKPVSVELSEWNYGAKYNSQAEEDCGKTNEFFTEHTPHRIVSVGSVTRFWRPTSAGCGSISSTSPILLNVDPQGSPLTPKVPLAPDAYCKVFASNFLVERFRNASSGKLVVNMTPTDGKMYYYADMSCRLAYYPVRTGEPGIGSGIGAEPARSPHSSGGKNPGDLPDLIMNDLYVVATEGDRTALTQLRLNRTYFCALQVKNVGNAGAWDTFANRCYLSKGNWWDHDPDNLGHANMKELRSGQSRRVFVPIQPFKYPGRFNVTADADTDGGVTYKAIKESDEGNNSHDEYQFDVVSDPNLIVPALTASAAEVQPNQAFTVTVTTKNAGESFGQDKQSTAVYIDGVLLSNHWRTRETLQGGMSETETVNVPGIATSSVHTITACSDFNGLIPETNENDNCASISITVQPAYVPPGPNDPGRTVVGPSNPTSFSLSCGTLPADADFSTMPAVMEGDVASVIIGNNHQRIFLPQTSIGVAGGWNERLQTWVFIDPSQVSRVCWSSNESGWGTTQASCSNGLTFDGSNWVADIPNTPPASKGVWTIKQSGDTVWLDSQYWTAVPPDSDGHIRYGGWDANRLTLTQDPFGYAVLTASFGVRGAPGYWFPDGAVMNGKAQWFSATDPMGTMPGSVTCDPATGKVTAKIVGVNPGNSGRLILGLSTPAGQYGWPILDQWTLPTGAVLSSSGEVTLPADFPAKYGNPQATYDKAAQRLTLTIRSDDLMTQAYWSVPSVRVLTDAVWFNAWIAPTGQTGKMIQGTLTRSDTGVWTIVFEGLPSGYGGSTYIVHTDAAQSWQNVASFRYSDGVTVHVDASKGEGWYIMP